MDKMFEIAATKASEIFLDHSDHYIFAYKCPDKSAGFLYGRGPSSWIALRDTLSMPFKVATIISTYDGWDGDYKMAKILDGYIQYKEIRDDDGQMIGYIFKR